MIFHLPSIFCSTIFLVVLYTDIRYHRIPNVVTLSAGLGGVLYNIAFDGFSAGLLFSLKGSLVGLGIFFIPFLLGGMGGGDVKFLGAIGCWLGISGVFSVFLYGALIGGVISLVIMISKGGFPRVKCFFIDILLFIFTKKKIEADRNRDVFPYSVPLAGGFVAYLIFGAMI